MIITVPVQYASLFLEQTFIIQQAEEKAQHLMDESVQLMFQFHQDLITEDVFIPEFAYRDYKYKHIVQEIARARQRLNILRAQYAC